jgi:hypothetical protein
MKRMQRITGRAGEPAEIESLDPTLKQALGDFKASVRAWSEAAYNRPRTMREVVVHRTLRLAAGWSLATVLLAGTVSVGLYEHHQQQVQARLVAAREAEHQRQLAAQRAREEAQQEDDILASVDTAVSREVPSAMEPLAALTDETEAK